jgi:pimeloyl-ACP methyl ester carboxylesterase
MADDFSDVVWTGSATRHVRTSLERSFSRAEVRTAWSIISPMSHAAAVGARRVPLLIVSGERDSVFLPELTRTYVERLRRHGLDPTWIRYACGHYTLAHPFYAARCFARTIAHLRAAL